MSHLRVKTTYETMGSYGSTDVKTLYCHHNLSSDYVTFYDEKGDIESMAFEDWSSGKDKWDAMQKLWSPYTDNTFQQLKDGVEHYFTAPWETKS